MAIDETVRLDEIWAGRFVFDEAEGQVHRQLLQPDRKARLELCAELRKDKIVPSDSPMGRWCLSIPLWDWERLGRDPKWCELHSQDAETAQRAMRRFLVHPDSTPFRVQENAS